tara:strand:+ start:256 stop:396 length:141 start_codon:yes stop_codon:yes gene_type:complete
MQKKKSTQFSFAKDPIRPGLWIIMFDGTPIGCIDHSAMRKLKAALK